MYSTPPAPFSPDLTVFKGALHSELSPEVQLLRMIFSVEPDREKCIGELKALIDGRNSKVPQLTLVGAQSQGTELDSSSA